eukprot:1756502-Rhodomonas_salina.2
MMGKQTPLSTARPLTFEAFAAGQRREKHNKASCSDLRFRSLPQSIVLRIRCAMFGADMLVALRSLGGAWIIGYKLWAFLMGTVFQVPSDGVSFRSQCSCLSRQRCLFRSQRCRSWRRNTMPFPLATLPFMKATLRFASLRVVSLHVLCEVGGPDAAPRAMAGQQHNLHLP